MLIDNSVKFYHYFIFNMLTDYIIKLSFIIKLFYF